MRRLTWAAVAAVLSGMSFGAQSADLTAYGPDLRDRCWMFGHDSGQHDFPGNTFNIPVSPKVTMGEACADMGVSNVCVCVWHLPDDGYLRQFDGLKRVAWCVDNGYLKIHCREDDYPKRLAAAFDRLGKLPNLMGFEYDDFFNGHSAERIVRDRLEDGTEVEVLKGPRDLAELRRVRARMRAYGRPLDMRLVLYTEELKYGKALLPVVDVFDTVTLWTWTGSNLAGLRDRFREYRRLVGPAKRTFLGIYMWDFGGKKPIGEANMKAQLDFALELFRAGQVHGFVFHCTPLVNKGLPEVGMVRRWIAEHGDEKQAEGAADMTACCAPLKSDESVWRFL